MKRQSEEGKESVRRPCSCRVWMVVAVALMAAGAAGGAETWRVGEGGEWKQTEASKDEQYLLRAAELRRLVDAGEHNKAKTAAEQLKKDYPDVAGKDFDEYIAAELLLAKGKVISAAARYDKFLDEYPESGLKDAAMQRVYEIGSAFLAGRRKQVLFFKIRGYEDGVKIMEKLSDRAGNTELGRKSALAIVEHYERRKKYDEAYLQWSEISTRWPTGQMGKDALLGMARNKYAANRGPEFDGSSLVSAKSYYENFRLRYPEDAERIGVADILSEIDQKLAKKNLGVAEYYRRTGNREAANLYYQMVIDTWPQSDAAKSAREQKDMPEPVKKEESKWLKSFKKLLL